jgi:hypothetical protein
MPKRVLVPNIVHDYDSIRATVIRARYCLESFLARGVPNLQLDRFLVYFDRSETKIDAYCAARKVNML